MVIYIFNDPKFKIRILRVFDEFQFGYNLLFKLPEAFIKRDRDEE